MPPMMGQHHGGRVFRHYVGLADHVASPIDASRNLGRAPILPSSNILSLSLELGPSRHYPLADGVGSPLPYATLDLHNFVIWSLNLTNNHFIDIYSLRTFGQILKKLWLF